MKAQMQNNDAVCIVCQESVTNPVCPECLSKEIRAWNPKVESSLVTPDFEGTEGVNCMLCGKKMRICAHCYTNDMGNLIGEKYPELQDDFKEVFGLREGLF